MSAYETHDNLAAPEVPVATIEQQQFYEAVRQMGISSPIDAFHRARRNARIEYEKLEKAHRLIRVNNRAKSMLGDSPFNTARIAALDAEIAIVEVERKKMREQQELLGRALVDLAPWIDATTTLDQRLELLNCNCADRAELGQLGEANPGMVHLIAVYCVEDSAAHRNDEWNDRPMHAAVNAEMHRVMFRTPEGKAASEGLFDELFAPGGMFEKAPKYFEQPDGTMLRQAPPLTVHDATGSRVIERKPS